MVQEKANRSIEDNNPSSDSVEFFKISLAEKNIEIECNYRDVFFQCRNYLSKFKKPDIVVNVTLQEIEKEQDNDIELLQRLFSVDKKNIGITYDFGQLESLLIYRKIADAMIKYGIILIHGAAISKDNRCYVFMAPSGTGKTTHLLNWLRMIPEAFVVNGDKPLVDVKNKFVYGTPWCGKEGFNTNTCVPLSGLIVLERGTINEIHRINFCEMLPILLGQSYIPTEVISVSNAFQLIAQLKAVPCYLFKCNMDKESAIVAYNELAKS